MVAGKLSAPVLWLAVGAVAAALLYKGVTRLGAGPSDSSWAANAGENIGSAAVDMATGVLTSSVETMGLQVGIPKTNASKGQAELESGDYWNASFDLPAGDFIKGVWRRWTE